MQQLSRRANVARLAILVAFASVLPCRFAAASDRPLKVFILAGQSNMQGHAHVRTFDAMRLKPSTAGLLSQMRNSDGTSVVCENVWISSIGSSNEEKIGQLTVGYGAETRGPKIGPEFTFGITASRLLDEPILIIKTAWGGKSLHTDFRPPTAGPYEFSNDQVERLLQRGKDVAKIKADKVAATGHYYRLMLKHIEHVLSDIPRVYPNYDATTGYELAGLVWFQGWNDMVDSGVYPNRDQPGGYDQYSDLLTHFIRNVREDLHSPALPFVIGVMGVGGPTDQYGVEERRYQSVHQNFRDAMAAPALLPEFATNVVAVFTEKFWDLDVVRLRARERTFKPKIDDIKAAIKAKTMEREAGQSEIEQLYAAEFNERELELLQQSTSNFDFHYMGSAGIMAQIGAAFAEAVVPMTEESTR